MKLNPPWNRERGEMEISHGVGNKDKQPKSAIIIFQDNIKPQHARTLNKTSSQLHASVAACNNSTALAKPRVRPLTS